MTLEEIRSKALEMAEPEFKKFEPIALANTKKILEVHFFGGNYHESKEY